MTAVAAPSGLQPVKNLGQRGYNSGVRMFKITNGYATAIFNGDVVKLNQAGTGFLEKDTGTTTATPVGIFLGVEYTDATFGKIQKNYWPASTVATDAVAYVCDDPQALFRATSVSSGTTVSGVALESAIGKNAALVQNTGSTANGKSKVAIGSFAVTATLPIRIVGSVPGSEDSSGNFTEFLVKWNFAFHQYDKALGL
jgi:hypothetical protein